MICGYLLVFGLSAVLEVTGETSASKEEATSGDFSQGVSLVARQEEVLQAFERLQGVLVRLAELGSPREPYRTALVRRAIREAEELGVSLRMRRTAELIEQGRLAAAIEEEERLLGDLQRILEILLAEDRDRRLQGERQELEKLLHELGQITRRQKDLHGRSGRNDQSPEALAPEQAALAEGAGRLAQSLRGSSGRTLGSEGEPRGGHGLGEGREQGPGGSTSGEGGKSAEGPAGGSAGRGTPGSERGGEGQTPAGDPSAGGAEASGSPESMPAASPSSAARQQAARSVEAAKARMQDAARRLAEARRREAVKDQEEALRELEAAKAQLEKILRQLRQEELARMLTDLRTRIDRMLTMQRKVYEETILLASRQEAGESRDVDLGISRLRRQQSSIGLEADLVAYVLEEDGTAGAMLEAIREVKTDIRLVEELFAERDLGPMNRSTQQAIIAALQEILDTLQQRLEELEREQEEGSGGFGPGKVPFVNLLAELRMVRTLQHRIRSRTEEYLRLLSESEQANERLQEVLRNLAERQARLQEITRNLSAQTGL